MTAKLAGNRSPDWAFMQRFDVPDYDDDKTYYLTRWRLIATPWFGIYLHRFQGPDPRPILHDHPWNFVSIILRGSYTEFVPSVNGGYAKRRNVGRINRKRATDLHWIDWLNRKPTWTLMVVGRRLRVWGYRDRDGSWTAFDKHPCNDEFLAALARRKTAQ